MCTIWVRARTRVEDTGTRWFLARARARTQHGCFCCTFGASRRSTMRRGLISLLLFLLVLCVDKLTCLCCWGGVVFVGFCLVFLLLCFFLCLFRFLRVCSLASVFCHCCWCCCFCCCGCCDSLVVLLMVLWLLWYSRRFSYGVFECFWLFELTVAILLDLYEIVTSRSSGVFDCFDWQLLLFLNCMIMQPPPPHRVRMLVFFVVLLLLLLLLLFLWYSCSRSCGSFWLF